MADNDATAGYETTSNGLQKYTDRTPSDLRDGYNRSMDVLDRKVSEFEQRIKRLESMEK